MSNAYDPTPAQDPTSPSGAAAGVGGAEGPAGPVYPVYPPTAQSAAGAAATASQPISSPDVAQPGGPSAPSAPWGASDAYAAQPGYPAGSQPGYDAATQAGYPYAAQPGYASAPSAGQAVQGYAPQAAYQQPQYAAGYAQPGVYPVVQKSKVAAGLLAIFLGTLGIHNFYLGRTGRGLAQLLISLLSLGFLAPFVAIWVLIEGILILTAQPGAQPWGVDGRGIPLAG